MAHDVHKVEEKADCEEITDLQKWIVSNRLQKLSQYFEDNQVELCDLSTYNNRTIEFGLFHFDLRKMDTLRYNHAHSLMIKYVSECTFDILFTRNPSVYVDHDIQ